MRIRACLGCMALLMLALSQCGSAGTNASETGFDRSSVLRLHIIANSDSEFDQSAKLCVRDALLMAERESMAGAESESDAKARVMEAGGEILQTVNDTLDALGCGYGAQLKLGKYEFPCREYAGEEYPAGEYEALRIVLGEGAGKNWWCVMFPPLCILELDDGNIDACELHMESYIAELIKSIDGGKLWEQIKAGWR